MRSVSHATRWRRYGNGANVVRLVTCISVNRLAAGQPAVGSPCASECLSGPCDVELFRSRWGEEVSEERVEEINACRG